MIKACTSANPYVFLVGSPRSGTTMLKRMVSAHPQIAITRETHWIPRFFEKQKGVTAGGLVTPQLPERMFEYHRFHQMKFRREELELLIAERPNMSYAELVSKIFDNYGRRKGKAIVGDKTPTCVRKIPTLATLWPKARFVHLVRDGRDVWLSMRRWRMAHRSAGQFSTWNSDPVTTTALWWKMLVGRGHNDGLALGPSRYLEVHYEDLVADSDVQCRSLTRFLDVPYDDHMVNYFEGRTQHDEGLSANSAWLPPTPGLRNWRREMNAEEVERFEAAAGDLLAVLGYERSFPTPSAQVQRQTNETKRQVTAEIESRGWKLPDPW